jgi:hypothetical protein
MRRRKVSLIVAACAVIVGAVFLSAPLPAAAQRHGGGGAPGMGGGGLSGGGRATGVEEKDDLKDFHRAMDVQATTQQVADFRALLKSTDAAKMALKDLIQQAAKENDAASLKSRNALLNRSLANALAGNKNFLEGFSEKQKNGLKETAKRLTKADSEVVQSRDQLDQAVNAIAAAEIASRCDALDKVLADFYEDQLSLGLEMGIDAATAQGRVFALAPVKSPVAIAKQSITVAAFGSLSQVAAENGQRTFKLQLTADLSDLQLNILHVLREQLDRSESCGQRISIRQAMLTPSAPVSVLSLKLHFERWTCIRMSGQAVASELAEGDGAAEIKLTVSVAANTLKITPEFTRVDASGMVGDALRTGALGEDLRAAAASSLLSAIQGGSDFKVVLPPAAQSSATLQGARFQDSGAGNLIVVLGGEIKLSDEQTAVMATQLKTTLSAEENLPKSAN